MKVGNINDEEIERKFDIAVQLVKSLPQSSSFSPSYSEATKIYSYFKQSKFGPCSIPRPGFWDVVSRTKWDAWSALGDMSAQDAMKNYVEAIKGVYNRIKQIDAFEARHHEFADTLIPFCQTTGIALTTKLMEIVKSNKPEVNGKREVVKKTEPVNGQVNGDIQCDENDTSTHITMNGMELCMNGLSHGSSSNDNNDLSPSVEINRQAKSVKFQITGDVMVEENQLLNVVVDTLVVVDAEDKLEKEEGELSISSITTDTDDHKSSSFNEEPKEPKKTVKEEGELSTSDDSDDGEIYCDSIDPGQLSEIVSAPVPLDMNESLTSLDLSDLPDAPNESLLPIIAEPAAVVTEEIPVEVVVENDFFSPIASTNTFLDTTAQNILTKKSKHSQSSSNNSRSDFELVDMNGDENKAFRSVRKRDYPQLACCNEVPVDKVQLSGNSLEKSERHQCNVTSCVCHCGLMTHKRKDHHSSHHRQHRGAKHTSSNHTDKNTETSNNENNASTSNHSTDHQGRHRHHNSHNRRSDTDGSNYGGSRGNSGGSTSSSSSDNIGLKIIKALERMDDNMHLILNRLNSIDTSMKTLAKLPPEPWWVKHIPSRFVILSTLWPVIINLLFYYFWRRNRRRRQLKAINKCISSNLNQV